MAPLPVVSGYTLAALPNDLVEIRCEKCGERWIVARCPQKGLRPGQLGYLVRHPFTLQCLNAAARRGDLDDPRFR